MFLRISFKFNYYKYLKKYTFQINRTLLKISYFTMSYYCPEKSCAKTKNPKSALKSNLNMLYSRRYGDLLYSATVLTYSLNHGYTMVEAANQLNFRLSRRFDK